MAGLAAGRVPAGAAAAVFGGSGAPADGMALAAGGFAARKAPAVGGRTQSVT
jgi:hypothetical protein